MGLGGRLSAIISFLRAGYPAGTPETGYAPVLALLRRRVSDSEGVAIARKLVARRHEPDAADIGVEITRVTDEMPSPDDIARIQHRLSAERLR
jgi:hypothetical protein